MGWTIERPCQLIDDDGPYRYCMEHSRSEATCLRMALAGLMNEFLPRSLWDTVDKKTMLGASFASARMVLEASEEPSPCPTCGHKHKDLTGVGPGPGESPCLEVVPPGSAICGCKNPWHTQKELEG